MIHIFSPAQSFIAISTNELIAWSCNDHVAESQYYALFTMSLNLPYTTYSIILPIGLTWMLSNHLIYYGFCTHVLYIVITNYN